MLFVLNHMGRPDRLWHMLPFIGIYNFPGSMLSWDVIVLVGYLLLNIIGGFYYLYKKYTGEPLNNAFYLPVIYVAIVWALSIHTVTAFLINTMPARPAIPDVRTQRVDRPCGLVLGVADRHGRILLHAADSLGPQRL